MSTPRVSNRAQPIARQDSAVKHCTDKLWQQVLVI
jgi:hypothetical protein